ncbi:MAG: ABC transporter substrate-binding protein [Bacteroidales bacterium]|nr:ABC transporter substrate-binding protein [Bacteroidales bacterium]
MKGFASWKRSLFSLLLGLLSFCSISGQTYKRIISLAPSLTMNLYYLESQDRLIGCTSYCEIAKTDNKPIVASAVNTNIEKVISQDPDLVLAPSTTSLETIAMLKRFGIEVEVFQTPDSFNEICSQFKRMGLLLGKVELADKKIAIARLKVDSLQKECTWVDAPRIFIQIGAKPLYTVIPNTFMNDYIRFINGTNLAFDLNRGTITRETVIARNPDVIFIVTMGIIGNEEKEIWEDFREINASRNGRVFLIDANMACTPTPVSFVHTLDIIVSLLNQSLV